MDINNSKRLYRSNTDKVVAGVCGGLGEYFNMDALIFRIIFLVLLFAGGSGFWLYIIFAILIPKAPFPGQAENPGTPRDHVQEFVADVKQSAQHWAGEMRSHQPHHPHSGDGRRTWLGLVIVAVGVLVLINQLFPQPWIRWDVLWPVVIIVFGVAIISKGNR